MTPKRDEKIRNKHIDQTDCNIIKLLQKNGRLSNTEIAKKLGVSEATIRARLSRLIKEEYIQIVAVSNPLKIGFKITGSIRINVEPKKVESVTKKLQKINSLWFIVHTTGGTDIYAEFIARSNEELNELIFEKINKIEGVIRTDTSLILKFVKRQFDWGTGY